MLYRFVLKLNIDVMTARLNSVLCLQTAKHIREIMAKVYCNNYCNSNAPHIQYC